MLIRFAEWLVEFVHQFGYWGLFIMTFLESTFVPVPSELTMIPAGYLVFQGKMNLGLVLLASIGGTILGAVANYLIAAYFGRRFLQRYGKYMLFSADKMSKLDSFFARHGEISTFTGRLIPGVRHVISFPAGLARMDLKKFCVYTAAGGTLWMCTLVVVGFLIGGNHELVKHTMPYVITGVLLLGAVVGVIYVRSHRRRQKREESGQ